MRNRVNDRLAHNLRRNLIRHGHLGAMFPRAHRKIDFRHDEINRLIHHIEYRTLVNLIRWNRLGHFCAVEMRTFHFGRNQKPLGLFPEKQHRRMGGPTVIKQVQMGQHLQGFGALRQRESTGFPS